MTHLPEEPAARPSDVPGDPIGPIGPIGPIDTVGPAALRAAGSLKWGVGEDEIGAWVAEMDLGIAPAVSAALVEAVRRGAVGYPTPAQQTALAEACADFQRSRHGWSVEPERVHAVGDVLQALTLVLDHWLAPGTPVVLPTPAYMPFVTVPELLGHRVIQSPMAQDATGWRLDLNGIARALGVGGGLVILTNPHNPTGRVFTRAELVELAAVVDRYGARVFADEIHAPLVYPGATHVPYASLNETTAAHTITATAASKGWNLPGLKCAQLIVTNDADEVRWRRVADLAGHGASPLGLIAGAAAYSDGVAWLDDAIRYLDGNRRELARALAERAPAVGHHSPQGTYLAWLDLRAVGDGRWARGAAARLRAETGVVVTDGDQCGDAGRGSIRFNFGLPRPVLATAIERMTTAFAG